MLSGGLNEGLDYRIDPERLDQGIERVVSQAVERHRAVRQAGQHLGIGRSRQALARERQLAGPGADRFDRFQIVTAHRHDRPSPVSRRPWRAVKAVRRISMPLPRHAEAVPSKTLAHGIPGFSQMLADCRFAHVKDFRGVLSADAAKPHHLGDNPLLRGKAAHALLYPALQFRRGEVFAGICRDTQITRQLRNPPVVDVADFLAAAARVRVPGAHPAQ